MCGCRWTLHAALLQHHPWPMCQAARKLLAMRPEATGNVLLLVV